MERDRAPESRQSEILRRLEQAIGEIHDSESFRRYLDMQARFHRYSPNNVALILSARPDATRVAGFRAWRRMDRFVMKGERGIKILVPMTKKVENHESGEEEKRVFFGVGTVFDVSQTQGRPLEEIHVPVLEGEQGADLYTKTWEFLTRAGVRVEAMGDQEEERHPTLMGYFLPETNLIRIRNSVSQLQRTKTLLHETAHLIGGHGECSWLPRDEAETEAESVAYVVGAHFGLDTGERSFPYVALWSQDRQTFQAVLGKIQTTSARVIDGIEGPLKHAEPGLE
jgi:hypothetical protein